MSSTFKWYTGRSEVATSKDIPQDARSIVEWWHTLLDVYVVEEPFPDPQTGAPMVDAQTGRAIVRRRWCLCLPELGEARLVELGRKYGADYVLTVRRPRLNLEIVYESPGGPYVIYRLPRRSGAVFHVGGADP